MANTTIPEVQHKKHLVELSSPSSKVTYNNGGHIKEGKIVTVGVKITISESNNKNAVILEGLPVNQTNGTVLLVSSVSVTSSCRLSGEYAYLNEDLPIGEYWISGSYIAYWRFTPRKEWQ